jgi:acyl-coenzyme A thioesterase PaaI-like protein
MNFLRRPPPAPLIGECRILKLGRRLAVVEVAIRPEAGGDMVAHATATYSVPPGRAVS